MSMNGQFSSSIASVALALAAAACSPPTAPAQPTNSNRSATMPMSADSDDGMVSHRPQRVVGDVGGGGSQCPTCVFASYTISAVSGDTLQGRCSTAPPFESFGFCEDQFRGTGRFAGSSAAGGVTLPDGSVAEFFGFVVVGPGELAATLIIETPAPGFRFFLIKGVLDANWAQSIDSSCSSGNRTTIHLSGVLEHVGRIEGTLSYCVP
jgi:hypothetical protein